MTYEATPQEIVRLFTEWESTAAQSANPRVSNQAPLDPPSIDEAAALIHRLRGIHEELEENDVDWHGRPVAEKDQSAMGQLWEEWRDEKLDVWNSYRAVWRPDPY